MQITGGLSRPVDLLVGRFNNLLKLLQHAISSRVLVKL